MITPEEKQMILDQAYVPEHSVDLMTSISGGEPFFFEDYFCCRAERTLIMVGYPLAHEFDLGRFENALRKAINFFQPARISLIAPHAPISFHSAFVERETDSYYTLQLPTFLHGPVERAIRKAKRATTVEQAKSLTEAHTELAREFLERSSPSPRVTELLWRMWDYVPASKDGVVLNAWDSRGKLAAFFVVDFAPKDFGTYIIGCHSKTNYVPGASDLLVSRMIELSTGLGKHFIHLGIGVNAGIRRFKEKWGGLPTQSYELCELAIKKPSLFSALLNSTGKR